MSSDDMIPDEHWVTDGAVLAARIALDVLDGKLVPPVLPPYAVRFLARMTITAIRSNAIFIGVPEEDLQTQDDYIRGWLTMMRDGAMALDPGGDADG